MNVTTEPAAVTSSGHVQGIPGRPHITRLKVRPRERLLEHALRMRFLLPDAEDLSQDAYVLLLLHLQRDEPIRDGFGLLVGCLEKSGLSTRTRERRRSRILEQRPPAAGAEPSGEDRWIARCMVEQVMDGLAPVDAELLRWRFLEEHTPREIAERLGITVEAVWKRINRALTKARILFGADE